MRRTATLETSNLVHASAVALGGALVWALLTLVTGYSLAFLVVPATALVGFTMIENTVERGPRLLALAAAGALLCMVMARLGAATFAGVGLMADVIRDDEAFHRQVIYADEMRQWLKDGRLPPVLAGWLDDTSQAPDEKLEVGLNDWLSKAQKRFEQRSDAEQEDLYRAYAQRMLDEGSAFERLGVFVGLVDLAWLFVAILAGGWFAMGYNDTQRTHFVGEVPQERLTTFDDLQVGGFDTDDDGFDE